MDRAVAPLGLTHAQYTLLGSLYGLSLAGTRPSQRKLADFAGLEPIYVSKLIRALESAGMVVRDRHPADPRALRLTLTGKGLAAIGEAMTVVQPSRTNSPRRSAAAPAPATVNSSAPCKPCSIRPT